MKSLSREYKKALEKRLNALKITGFLKPNKTLSLDDFYINIDFSAELSRVEKDPHAVFSLRSKDGSLFSFSKK